MHHKTKYYLLGIIWGIFGWAPEISATNILKIGHYQIAPNTEFTVQLEAENDSSFVAFQVDIPLPNGFKYIDGSAVLNATRISGHSLSASLLSGNILRLIGYSVSNTAFLGNTGTMANFTLKSCAAPATYSLNLLQPMLGNSRSVNVLTSSTNGSATVLAPNINVSTTSINFGRVPLGTSPEQSFQITNEGNMNLTISSLNFSDSQFTTTVTPGFVISPNGSRSIPVKFIPTAKGMLTKQLVIGSNDSDQPSTIVTLNAVAFAVNEIHTGSITGASSSSATLEFTLNNMEAFSGFQFDLALPSPMTYKAGSGHLFRSQDQTVSVSQINAQTLRVLVYSSGNKNFTGNDGKVLSLDFSLNGTAGYYYIGMGNIVLANTVGENILSASYNGNLYITSPDIDASTQVAFGDVSILSQANQTLRIKNYGQEPLTITQLIFSSAFFTSSQTLPVTIPSYGTLDLPVVFSKTTEGTATGTMKIISNDPDENPFTIQLSGNAFMPNYLKIDTISFVQGDKKIVPVRIENAEPFVAFQLDLSYPAKFTPDLNGIALTARKQDHVLSAISLSATSLRLLVYSPGQKTFTGNSGPIINIPFTADSTLAPNAYSLSISNAFLSDTKSENILYSSKNGVLQIQKFGRIYIPLITGWNIISSNVIPSITNLKSIIQPLIDVGKLKKVMDESGNAIENFGAFGGWRDGIGNFSKTEGYKINMSGVSTLYLEGAAVKLPLDISLAAGWNIISYPCVNPQNAQSLVQSLINSGKLKKVMDETGKSIENFGIFGGWRNNIGNFVAGKGFRINMIEAGTLTITSSELRSAINVNEILPSKYFKKAYEGNGTDHMNINLVGLESSGLQAGDEIGIYDEDICVGSAIIGKDQINEGSISIPASCNDSIELYTNGFIPGHSIGLRLYRNGEIFTLETEKLWGSDIFEKSGSLFAKVKSRIPLDIKTPDVSLKFNLYPNPFKEEISIEVYNLKSTELIVDIYNLFGQKVKSLYKGLNKGSLNLKWNGTDEKGNLVAPGIYICRVNEQSIE
jgi:Abnormal spindle-like microcephaly-assoc'd, ASPM-SPD-2-Hydin/Secretion system C-terminal sorting domain